MITTLSATFAANNTAVNFKDEGGVAVGVNGSIHDIVILGADASMDATISDGRGGGTGVSTVFSVTSVDSTTVLRYKVDDAAIKRNSVMGQLTFTPGNNTGAGIAYIWIKDERVA